MAVALHGTRLERLAFAYGCLGGVDTQGTSTALGAAEIQDFLRLARPDRKWSVLRGMPREDLLFQSQENFAAILDQLERTWNGDHDQVFSFLLSQPSLHIPV